MKSVILTVFLAITALICASSAHAQNFQKDMASAEASVIERGNQNYNPYTIHRRIAGVGLGTTMAATLVGSLAMDDEYFATTVIPVAGPFVTIARIESDPNSFYRPGGKGLLIASGASQTAFLGYFLWALISEKNYEGRNLSVAPSRNGAGLAVRYRF